MTPRRPTEPEPDNSPRYAPPVDLSKFAIVSIAAALVTIVLKSGAAWLTGSVGLLSDAAESLVNLVAAVVAFIALKVSIKPADDNHPYGHSKAEYFSAVVEGTMIFVAAAFIIVSAVERFINPRELEQLGLGLAISVLAAVVNGAVGLLLLRKGRGSGSATLVADGKHLLTDVVTSAAVLIGVGLVALTHQPRLDPIVALLAGVNILWTGIGLIRDSVNGLMDITLPDETNEKLEAVLDRFRRPGAIEFHAFRTRRAGNRQFMDVHVLVPGTWSVYRGHDFTEDLIDAIVEVVPDIRVSAHLEPIEDPRSYADEDDY
ncbi:cation diffusion facilitator family transporter [Propionimicrobium sp. PCR01-08-3]|uniref:cation diffusion facilitator family transporter n=1 Tax=Propionimicrobium sp. PCR01-08-3 TaxID=3052086 RepID=UPI00255C7DDF|nr:cation diffusion facilitator family transporter [Propionimicrobium sp. PCR01-08-3]WIY83108.1 cation diffusion facilitator family transporter [Propionimicrobium sp. PCR01-08-3]